MKSQYLFGLFCTVFLITFRVVFGGAGNEVDTWEKLSLSTNSWSTIATSSSGEIVAAGVMTGGIYLSTDSGASFILSSAPVVNGWISMVCSQEGNYIFAIDNQPSNNQIYISSDSGVTWVSASNAPTVYRWLSITTSSTGQFVAASTAQSGAQPGGGIYLSEDFGATWTHADGAPSNNVYWTAITSSADGQYLFATQSNYTNGVISLPSNVYVSSNAGADWLPAAKPLVAGEAFVYGAIATCNSGQFVFTVVSGTSIYLSVDFGSNFTVATADTGGADWQRLVASSSGKYVAATATNGVYLSDTFGVTWQVQSVESGRVSSFLPLASSSSGQQLFVGETSGFVYAGTGNVSIINDDGMASWAPSFAPSSAPVAALATDAPSVVPSDTPSVAPSVAPTIAPAVSVETFVPSTAPSVAPSTAPTLVGIPSLAPSEAPTAWPTRAPTHIDETLSPSATPSVAPSAAPSTAPSASPVPIDISSSPSVPPSLLPTVWPSIAPSTPPSEAPTDAPSDQFVSYGPTVTPSAAPSAASSDVFVSIVPSAAPSVAPTNAFVSLTPTLSPSVVNSVEPSAAPSTLPTGAFVSLAPSVSPSEAPTVAPSEAPTVAPSSAAPSVSPSSSSAVPTANSLVVFSATQVISGISYSAFQEDLANNTLALESSVVASVSGLSIGDISEFTASSARRLLSKERALRVMSISSSSDSISIAYVVTTDSPGLTYSTMTTQLAASVSSGAFDGYLSAYALQYQAYAMVNCTSSAPVTVDESPDATGGGSTDDGLSTGETVGIALGAAAFVVLALAATYCCLFATPKSLVLKEGLISGQQQQQRGSEAGSARGSYQKKPADRLTSNPVFGATGRGGESQQFNDENF